MKPAIFCLVALLCLPGAAGAQVDVFGVVPMVPPVPAAEVDYIGLWTYTSHDHSKTGPCPPGPAMSGELTIGKAGEVVTLIMLSGAVCDPESLCVLNGEVSGTDLVLTSFADLDEGATGSTAMRVRFSAADAAEAEVISRYIHPEGVECEWRHFLTLNRPSD